AVDGVRGHRLVTVAGRAMGHEAPERGVGIAGMGRVDAQGQTSERRRSGARLLSDRSAGLPSRLLDPPGRYVPPSDCFALWTAIRPVRGDPNMGIRLATWVNPELTEPLFLAVLSAGTLADAVAVVARFKRLLEPKDLVVVEDSAGGQFVVTYERPDCDER